MSEGRRVEFSAQLKPNPAVFSVRQPTPDGKDEQRVPTDGTLLLKILTMSREERVALLTASADDEVLLLFALLSPTERRQVIQAAETFLKDKVLNG